MNSEDIKKLTVADLKKELKARNLPMTGNKGDLVQRLTDHILNNEERQILESSGGKIDESLLEGVHEDEVLGLSSATPPVVKKSQPKIDVGQPVAASSIFQNSAAASATSPQIKGDQISGNSEAKKVQLKQSILSDSEKFTPATTTANAPTKIPVDPEQAKIDRAKKFNLPLTDTDKKKMRADRFGSGVASKSASSTGPKSNPELLQKRAERFGIPVVQASKTGAGAIATSTPAVDKEKLKQRAERFGLKMEPNNSSIQGQSGSNSNNNEALLKRKLRFGSNGSSSGGGGGNAATSEDMKEKKKARAERFGLPVK